MEDKDYKYSLSIIKQELKNKFITREIKYAFKASIESLEKQIPMKVKFKVLEKSISKTQTIKHHSGQCPVCNAPLTTHYDNDYCSNCGQKIDWN